MAIGSLVKKIQNIMREDAGVNGNAQRIEQMVWMFFLKIYDAKEEEWELVQEEYESIIPDNSNGGTGRSTRRMGLRLQESSFSIS